MAKIRHIAYRATDVDAMAKFFVDAMGMKLIQKRKNNAIDLSDGSVNITVLPLRAGTSDGEPTKQPGIDHIGFSAENDQEQFRMLEAAGAKKAGTLNLGTAYYEDKFVGPEDIIIDVGCAISDVSDLSHCYSPFDCLASGAQRLVLNPRHQTLNAGR